MGMKEQFSRLKDNWLLIVLFGLGFLMIFFLSIAGLGIGGMSRSVMSEAPYAPSYQQSYNTGYSSTYDTSNSLMPDVIDRIIVKTASMSTIVKDWDASETSLKSYIASNDAIVTNENVNTAYGKYMNGQYTINVPTDKYDALVTQLKSIGELQSFSENANDITGSYIKLQDLIASEKDRLASYQKLYNSSSAIKDKTDLLDTIYSLQNRITSLENQLQNQNDRIDYSQIRFTMQEKRPTYSNVVFASLGDLWSSFKQSLNVMLYLIAYLLPFVLLWLLIWWIVHLIRGR